MLPRVNGVRHIGDYRLELSFTDGTVGEADFRNQVTNRGGVFQAFDDPAFFGRVELEPEAGPIIWPNGVDLCPDVLYSLVTGKPLRQFEHA